MVKKENFWYQPTVSTKITSKLAASQTKIDSSVVRVTPPKLHLFGEDLKNIYDSNNKLNRKKYFIYYLIKASGSLESSCILTLSPRIEPILNRIFNKTIKIVWHLGKVWTTDSLYILISFDKVYLKNRLTNELKSMGLRKNEFT